MYVQTQTIETLKAEFRLDPDGKVWATVKGTAALCGRRGRGNRENQKLVSRKDCGVPECPRVVRTVFKRRL